MAGKPKKEFHQYLTDTGGGAQVSHDEYLKSPATAFLRHTIEAKSAIDLCSRKFPKNADNSYSKASLDSLQHLTAAVLPTIMGHFETYQRYLFGGIFDRSVHLQGFDIEDYFKKLNKQCNVTIDPVRLAAYRGLGASSIGNLLADSLHSWHNPEKVNAYFNCFNLGNQIFSNDAANQLSVLWQLRHSIVHTGGTLTLPDAQKVGVLKDNGDKQIVFENQFIFEVARKLHPTVKVATEGIGNAFKGNLKPGLDQAVIDDIDLFFDVKSTIAVWLK
jgi:hypothetical protein